MDATSDDLLKPLGLDLPDGNPRQFRQPMMRIFGAVLASVLLGVGIAAAIMADPLGGKPLVGGTPQAGGERQVAALVESRVAHESDPPRREPDPSRLETDAGARAQDLAAAPPRRTASEIETASGVSVIRPNGAAAPASLVIRIPEDAAVVLNPAPDSRLIERTRQGLLPKIGADGSRPSMVYARPAGTLPDGARPDARVAIMVGGLGLNQTVTTDAIAKLPAPVTLAFAPYGSDLNRVVPQAREEGHEVMLQVPMEPFDYPGNDPGPHTLTTQAKQQENIDRLHWAMSRFTGYTGLVNFLGAKLTADEAALAPILREVGGRGLAFLDDGSSPRSLAGGVGPAAGAATARADVVLDGAPRADAIDKELNRLEGIARERGFAIGAASALPVTVERIARWTRTLEARGILLVPVSAAFRHRDPR